MSLLLTGVLATSLLTGCGSTDDNTAKELQLQQQQKVSRRLLILPTPK